jgi:hypothetical protein
MSHVSSRSVLPPALLVVGLGLSACSLYGTEPPPSRGAGDVEQVVLKITEVPADVRCVRISAAGETRTVVREVESTGGATLTESLTGLPIGTVVFTGEAFTAACTSVTKSTVAPWASAPVEASIVVGRLSTVELSMVRNGRAKVEVTFTDEAACTATGAECRINSECCSRKCSAGACVVTDAGARD